MCGIFGVVLAEGANKSLKSGAMGWMNELFLESQSRGKEAAGLAFEDGAKIGVYKAAVPAGEMIRSRNYRSVVKQAIAETNGHNIALIGHSRLVTDGSREDNLNNQPVVRDGIVGVHNGIIVNHNQLWRDHGDMDRRTQVDSEILLALVRRHLRQGLSLESATSKTFSEISGAASIAFLFADIGKLLLATNTGSLYYRGSKKQSAFLFASERPIVDSVTDKPTFAGASTVHLRPGQGAIVDLTTAAAHVFSFQGPLPEVPMTTRETARPVVDKSPAPRAARPSRPPRGVDKSALESRFPYVSLRDKLRRCRDCVLPETMPFVDFDSDGVCAYCRNHSPMQLRGQAALEAICAPHRRSDGRPDCVVGISGGRDSMYGLHYIKTVLGLNPIAYTYDWGMVTDLARRNISRICGQLGVEHVLVSADIPRKRAFIRRNVEAWLARPSLGTVPLFMAGDKAYFYHLERIRKQHGVSLAFLCENLLERTDFKTGFAGLRPKKVDEDHAYTIPLANKLRLARFYLGEVFRNPRYVNTSMADSAWGFACYYLMKRDYMNLYGYVPWDEQVVEATLIGDYGFELAEDTDSTWRIGDGTASFYNYIYHAMAGLTENDTFRSNQIRHGVLTREEALEKIERHNRPRFPSIQWYLDTIGVERSLAEVLDTIDRAPKRYQVES